MALTDINFQEGEIQDFLLELPSVMYAGSATDILIETSGSQYPLLEAPVIVNTGSNIFIMSE